MQRKMDAVDRDLLAKSGIREMLISDFGEALRQGSQGLVDDIAANHGRPWCFALDRIETPVSFWYADKDRSVPSSMGRDLAGQVPEDELHLIEKAGHLWPVARLRQFLTEAFGTGAKAR